MHKASPDRAECDRRVMGQCLRLTRIDIARLVLREFGSASRTTKMIIDAQDGGVALSMPWDNFHSAYEVASDGRSIVGRAAGSIIVMNGVHTNPFTACRTAPVSPDFTTGIVAPRHDELVSLPPQKTDNPSGEMRMARYR